MSEIAPKRRFVRRNTTASSHGSAGSAAAPGAGDAILPPKRRIIRRKPEPAPPTAAAVASAVAAPIKTPTVVQQLADRIIVKIPDGATLIESMDAPIEVADVKPMHLQSFTHQGINYWKDEDSKLFHKTEKNRRGPFVGRWDSELEEIHDDTDV